MLDLDEGLKDPKHPNPIKSIYDSGDHLHPNDRGNRHMAEISEF